MSEAPITDTRILLHAYRNAPDWQAQIKSQMAAFVAFLHDNNLLVPGALQSEEERSGLFRLDASDLTEDGKKLIFPPISAYSKWLSANSNPNKPLSMRSLENGLKKVRGSGTK